MKFAVLSDIHGNMFALNAVLEDMKKFNPERVFCLGDLAMAGPEPDKTIDFVRKQNWTVIQGNTDAMIVNFSESLFEKLKKSAPIMANALKSDVENITDDNKKYLKNLPANHEETIENLKFLFVHGSPRKNDENVFPNMSAEEIEEIFKNVNADVVFCGHTHMPCGYQTKNKVTVVNDGSVGRPFTDNPQACYVIAEAKNGALEIEHRMVDYDKESAKKILAKRQFEGADKLSEMLVNPQSRHM